MGENRKLVIEGLKVLNGATRPGIAALAQISGLTPGSMTAESIGFRLGPRINAAGRLAHAYSAARLLIADNAPTAERLAHELNQLNQQRQALTAELCDMAEGLIQPDANILIAADTGFVSGVVGLVAGRLAEKYYRPAVVIETGSEESRGSCRSITEFHITEALDEVAHLLVRHGGHAQAAGFTVRNENLPQFRQALSDIAARELSGRELVPTLAIDAELPCARSTGPCMTFCSSWNQPAAPTPHPSSWPATRRCLTIAPSARMGGICSCRWVMASAVLGPLPSGRPPGQIRCPAGSTSSTPST